LKLDAVHQRGRIAEHRRHFLAHGGRLGRRAVRSRFDQHPIHAAADVSRDSLHAAADIAGTLRGLALRRLLERRHPRSIRDERDGAQRHDRQQQERDDQARAKRHLPEQSTAGGIGAVRDVVVEPGEKNMARVAGMSRNPRPGTVQPRGMRLASGT
jgi:hypothetical protein